MENIRTADFSPTELDQELAAVLPDRDLMITISVLGLPLLGIGDVTVNVNTVGPNWLLGSIGKV
jgi:hypothetical protein